MSDNPVSPIPDDFIEQVKQALEHLYDFPFLQHHPLATLLPTATKNAEEPIGHRLRRELIAAIDTLNPGSTVSVRSGISRLFNLMHLHYVGGMTIQETALELGISLRQAYRDLRRGQESVSEILWFNQNLTSHASTPTDASTIHSEVARIEGEVKATTITQHLTIALRAVEKLAERQNIILTYATPTRPVVVHTNSVIAQQVLVSFFSQTVQQLNNQTLDVRLLEQSNRICLTITHKMATLAYNDLLLGLLNKIEWQLSQEPHQVSIIMNGLQASVLIIDDNEGLHTLLERYFTGYPYQLIYATNGADGLALAQNILPDVIIMDLMMPHMDGWELLQRLKLTSPTNTIPVIICSVINDPELAYSLGATHFIAKPLNKDDLLNALHALGF
jgi:CheY-like chemotaxis protein